MTDTPESHSGLDMFNRPLTVAQLGNRIISYAYEDERFAERRRPKTGCVQYWEDDSGYLWSADLEVEHVHDERRYLGACATLSLNIARKIPIMSSEAQYAIEESGLELPRALFSGSKVHFNAQYVVSQYDTLGITQTRTHVLAFSPEALEYRVAGMQDIGTNGAEFAIERVIQDIPVLDIPSEQSEDPEIALFEALDLDGYTRDAARVFEMVQTRSEGDFDLARAFPKDVIKAAHVWLEDSED